jgi:predicted nucleotide-binding protein
METHDKIDPALKRIYVHLQLLLFLHDFIISKEFDLFCEENGLEEIRNAVFTSLHKTYGIPRKPNYFLTMAGKIRMDFSSFPEELVKPFLKDFLIEIYKTKNEQFVKIVVSLLTYYSRYNCDLKNGKPIPISDDIMCEIGFDLLDLDYDEPDITMYYNMAGYNLENILAIHDQKSTDVQAEPVAISKKHIVSGLKDKNGSNNRKIFIVHGHDHDLLGEVEQYLESLNLKPIVLNKQADLGKTIIEKVEHYVAQTSFAIVILTKDDFGVSKIDYDIETEIGSIVHKLNNLPILLIDAIHQNEIDKISPVFELVDSSKKMLTEIKPRARQNVIFELGLTIGHLRRDRVRVLYEEGVELPTDIHGLAYTPLRGDWKKKLAQEINASGISIDAKFF